MILNLNITEYQVEQFKEDGYIVIENIIDMDTVEMLRERAERLFNGEFETGLDPDEVNWTNGRSREDVTRQICNAWKADRYIASVMLRPEIGKACALLGNWPGARLTQDNILWKPPGGKPIGFHQDSSYEEFILPNEWVSCWIALDDTTVNGGTLEYVKGSHRWHKSGKIRQFHAPNDPHEDLTTAAAKVGITDIRTDKIVVPAGGGTFHSGWTWHGSKINHSDVPRRSVVSHCMSSDSQYNPNSTAVNRTYSRYKRFGDCVMDETHFPVLWRNDGYRSPFIEPFCDREIGWADSFEGKKYE